MERRGAIAVVQIAGGRTVAGRTATEEGVGALALAAVLGVGLVAFAVAGAGAAAVASAAGQGYLASSGQVVARNVV